MGRKRVGQVTNRTGGGSPRSTGGRVAARGKGRPSPVLLLIGFLTAVGCGRDGVSAQNETRFTDLRGAYLGQDQPGATPSLFAPGVVSVENHFEHSGAVFSPDMTELYWAAKPQGSTICQIFFMKSIDGRWTAPQVVPFTQEREGNRPTFSPDGQTLYFQTIRNPLGGPILAVAREGEGWSQPWALPPLINETGMERPFSTSRDGALYFGRGFGEEEEILVSRLEEGRYLEPTRLGSPVNTTLSELHIFVSPDETYMILESSNHVDIAKLSISYRTDGGSWTEPVELPFGWARFPVVSPDGQYLFFMSHGGIHWVSTAFVEELRPEG